MKEYYLLMGLNQKEVKITKVSLNNNSIIEVKIESGKVNFQFSPFPLSP